MKPGFENRSDSLLHNAMSWNNMVQHKYHSEYVHLNFPSIQWSELCLLKKHCPCGLLLQCGTSSGIGENTYLGFHWTFFILTSGSPLSHLLINLVFLHREVLFVTVSNTPEVLCHQKTIPTIAWCSSELSGLWHTTTAPHFPKVWRETQSHHHLQ